MDLKNSSAAAHDSHRDFDDLWAAGAADDNLDLPEPLPAAHAVGVPQTFDPRQAVCLGRETVFDSLLATQDSDVLAFSFAK